MPRRCVGKNGGVLFDRGLACPLYNPSLKSNDARFFVPILRFARNIQTPGEKFESHAAAACCSLKRCSPRRSR
jgi:hypothetical protein